MKIVVLESSPHTSGSSNLLASEFVRGATEVGHVVEVCDVAHADISPCLGCDHCRVTGECVHEDDMRAVRDRLLSADMVVFVTPLYYFGMSAQLKTAIDRFYAFNGELMARRMKSALLAVAWDSNTWTMEALAEHYRVLVRYLHLQDRGSILGVGCGTVDMTARSEFPQRAYELGRSM